jgi:protein-tyrosine-phosphatase
MTSVDQSLRNYRRKPRILFVGADNASHTQMAEGYMRSLGGEFLDVRSAGLQSRPVDRQAVSVMDEDGVDIRAQDASLISAQWLTWADLVVVLSRDSDELSVAVPNSALEKHWSVTSPEEDSPLALYRRCRDEVKRRVQTMIGAMRLFHIRDGTG